MIRIVLARPNGFTVKLGTLSITGVYPPQQVAFPLGQAIERNLSLRMANCNHRRYVPDLVRQTRNGELAPHHVVTQDEPLPDVVAAYEAFARHQSG